MAKETEKAMRLAEAAAGDYPEASEILVSFPDRWQLIHQMRREDTPLYVAAMPASQERTFQDKFHGLSPEINLGMTTYRQYRLFQPWPMPSVIVRWDQTKGTGQVEKMGDLKVQLQPLGDAQAWFGQDSGVLWECYLNEAGRRGASWQEEVHTFWQVVEKDMGVARIFTQPYELTWQDGYTDFLSNLGYAPDAEYRGWWSKRSPGE